MPAERITGKKIRQDLANIFNLKKGVFYTLWELFLKPGKTVMRYLNEDRSVFMNSFRLFVLVTTVYTFVSIKSGVMEMSFENNVTISATDEDPELAQAMQNEGMKLIQETMKDYLSIFAFLAIPVLALFTKLFFRKSDLNYAEHLTAQALLGSITTVIGLVALPIAFFNIQILSFLTIIVFLLYQCLFVWQISTKKNFGTIVKGILSYAIGYFVYGLIFGSIVGGYLVATLNT